MTADVHKALSAAACAASVLVGEAPASVTHVRMKLPYRGPVRGRA